LKWVLVIKRVFSFDYIFKYIYIYFVYL
jgi:hypothetical protein